jgi:hypothetical protein
MDATRVRRRPAAALTPPQATGGGAEGESVGEGGGARDEGCGEDQRTRTADLGTPRHPPDGRSGGRGTVGSPCGLATRRCRGLHPRLGKRATACHGRGARRAVAGDGGEEPGSDRRHHVGKSPSALW